MLCLNCRYLIEYVNSHDGKPIGPNTPYLCPEVIWKILIWLETLFSLAQNFKDAPHQTKFAIFDQIMSKSKKFIFQRRDGNLSLLLEENPWTYLRYLPNKRLTIWGRKHTQSWNDSWSPNNIQKEETDPIFGRFPMSGQPPSWMWWSGSSTRRSPESSSMRRASSLSGPWRYFAKLSFWGSFEV